MQVTLAEAESRLPELIQAVEGGEQVVITRGGKPVAQIAPPPPERQVRFDFMRGKIRMDPRFDDPITEEQFISGEW